MRANILGKVFAIANGPFTAYVCISTGITKMVPEPSESLPIFRRGVKTNPTPDVGLHHLRISIKVHLKFPVFQRF